MVVRFLVKDTDRHYVFPVSSGHDLTMDNVPCRSLDGRAIPLHLYRQPIFNTMFPSVPYIVKASAFGIGHLAQVWVLVLVDLGLYLPNFVCIFYNGNKLNYSLSDYYGNLTVSGHSKAKLYVLPETYAKTAR